MRYYPLMNQQFGSLIHLLKTQKVLRILQSTCTYSFKSMMIKFSLLYDLLLLFFVRLFSNTLSLHYNMLTLLYQEVFYCLLLFYLFLLLSVIRRREHCSHTTNSATCQGQTTPGKEREKKREREDINYHYFYFLFFIFYFLERF